MIVDTSAILAIVRREPGHEILVEKLRTATFVGAGTPTLTECAVVLESRIGPPARGLLERLIDEFAIVEIRFGEFHWREALDAFQRFGKGRHPARLNFADCMSYAIARVTAEPLLFVGDDFSKTDIEAA